MRVFLLLDSITLALAGGDHFGGELFSHRFLVATAREGDQPAHREGGAAIGADFDWNLVRRATDPAALHFDSGLEISQRLLEDRHAGLAGLVLDDVHRTVENSLSRRLLALVHDGVDELRDRLAIVARVGKNGALDRFLTATHFFLPPPAAALGFLVPYLERLLLRPLTPEASSEPRTI